MLGRKMIDEKIPPVNDLRVVTAETLQVIKEEFWEKPALDPSPGSVQDIRLKDQEYGAERRETLEYSSAVRILDSICTLLDSGDGSLFAAAFDLHDHVTVVLAKNGTPTKEDRDAAKELFRTVVCTKDDVWEFFPFILNRCHRRLRKSLIKLKSSLEQLDLEEVCKDYQVNSLEDEFPGLALLKEDGKYTLAQVFRIKIRRMVDFTIEQLGDILGMENEDTPFALDGFRDTLCKVYQLSVTRIVQHESEPICRVKLPRRLHKVNRYLFAAMTLQAQAHRLLSGGQKIHHRWATNYIPTSDTRYIKLHRTLSRILEPRVLNITPAAATKHREWYPNAWGNWKDLVSTCLHPEIRLITHLDGSELVYNALPSYSSYRCLIHTSYRLRAIGCSKRTCYACSIWIRAYNAAFKTKWAVSERDGRIYVDWALPGEAC
ncbi:hypothetical protein VKT23_000543 [Stygiomarasmius scandens]|uniref:Uncharacterized protein n=1 Tax=Marasmiellus scandens TaxID=2682957 RepID=A0ABR1K9T4_9AGAR